MLVDSSSAILLSFILQIDLGRQYRVTSLHLLTGDEQVMNLDVRVGDTDYSGTGDSRITGNTRCALYYGPR